MWCWFNSTNDRFSIIAVELFSFSVMFCNEFLNGNDKHNAFKKVCRLIACVRHRHLEANQEHRQQTRIQIGSNKGDMGLWVNVQICSEENYCERFVMLSQSSLAEPNVQTQWIPIFWADSKPFEMIRFRYAKIVFIWIQLLCGQFYRQRRDQIRAHFHFPKSQLEKKKQFLFLANVTVFSAL